ncbi:uncharacterized protein LOC116431578 isoform X2 [Nomia melanderi]|uniref:uncharacterized protein LOC116431578 isoform X2 n=1 Tax=Nomia melanderi TaxID=2448451 RepID=UPI0013040087|nr:uncharacterized protein LOC116431578 isoform X2 [Nomia melanderi]
MTANFLGNLRCLVNNSTTTFTSAHSTAKAVVGSARYRVPDIRNKFRSGGIDRAMNHIARTFDPKPDPRTPTCERLIPGRSCNQSPTTTLCGSWKSKMLAEVMECKDAIKSKASRWGSKLFAGSRLTTPVSSIPDIVTFSVIAKEEVLIGFSPRDTSETQKKNTLAKPRDESNPTNGLVNRFLDKHSTNGTPRLFLEHEKSELPEEGVTESAVKRKISVHPLLLRYSEDTDEFDWFNDTDDSFSSKLWDSPECSNVSDIVFDDPQNNSTFRKSLYESKKSEFSAVRLDSGWESNFSI